MTIPRTDTGEIDGTMEAILASLGRLEAGQAQMQEQPSGDPALLIADCRASLEEGIGALHTELTEVTHALQILQAPPVVPSAPRWPWWLQSTCGVVGGMLFMSAVWWCWPVSPYARLAGGLDSLLVQTYATLPRPVQDQVLSVYTRYGVQPPSQRQKGSR